MRLHGTDDGYFYVDSGHEGLGIDKEKIKLYKRVKELEQEKASRQTETVAAPASRSWMLWGGVALVAVAAAAMLMKKRKSGVA